MKASLKRPLSFILTMVLCFSLGNGVAFAEEQGDMMTGVQVRPNTGILTITSMELVSNGALFDLVVSGITQRSNAEIIMTLRNMQNNTISNFDATRMNSDEFTGVIPEIDPMENGYYYLALSDTKNMGNAGQLPSAGYKIVFQVKDNQIVVDDPANPPWEDVHADYELSATPQAINLDNAVYGQNVSTTSITLKNSGWLDLSNVTMSAVYPEGVALLGGELPPSLGSGESLQYEVTQDTSATPGSYTAELSFTADNIDPASAAAVSVTYTIEKATQAAVTGFDMEAATTKGGLGKITGLTSGGIYELGVDPYEEGDWFSITADDSGNCEVTPGAYALRLPANDFYEAGDSVEVKVPDFYYFESTVINDMRAGVGTNYPVCDLLSGGIEPLSFSCVGELPEGLDFTSDGYITGTAVVVTDSSFVLNITVTDSNENEADRVRTGVVTIAGITKGDQATPEAISLTASDITITIENWNEKQEYAATTDEAITLGGLSWTQEEVLTGLSPNKPYTVYTRLFETDLLNPSPVVTEAAMTQQTTIASVTISGSGIVGEYLEAVVSPAAATVSYDWKTVDNTLISTAASIEVTEDLVNTDIILTVTGEGDYKGTLETDPYLVGGSEVSVQVASYDPGKTITAVLTSSNGAVSFSAIGTTASGLGACVQTVTFSGVRPGLTYDLCVSKKGHTSLTIRNIEVGNDGLSITTAGALSELRLYCGDFDGDDAVRLSDRASLLRSKFYGKAVSEFTGEDSSYAAMLDVDGDGYVKFNDLAMLMSAQNYGKTGVSTEWK